MPNDMSEWQAAVSLLAGSDEIWPALRGPVLHERSLGPVICELDGPRRPWSSSERQVLVWSAHLWDADRHQARFPYEFDRYNFGAGSPPCTSAEGSPPPSAGNPAAPPERRAWSARSSPAGRRRAPRE
jgi:hypothetical protein